MKILLVAGGEMPIPPTGWGAVEKLIWEEKGYLESQGHVVGIVNEQRRRLLFGMVKNQQRVQLLAGLFAMPWRYDFVHVQVDGFVPIWMKLTRWFRLKMAVTTYYGYAPFPELWDEGYRHETFPGMAAAQNVIALSPQIKAVMLSHGFTNPIYVCPSGITCADIEYRPQAVKPAILLGKIQERKKQKHLCHVLAGKPVKVDLIGPCDECDFQGNGDNVIYRGEWTRAQVRAHLTDYACLVLISDGEAHPIAVLEAMAAGLSLVISPECAHNLDVSQPWVHVVDRDKDDLASVIRQAVQENPRYRADIRRFCETTFDWQIIGKQYLNILERIIKGVPPSE